MFFPGSPLNYPTNTLSVIRRYEANRAPNTFDLKNFNLGDEWLDIVGEEWYKLVSKKGNVADWCQLCADGTGSEEFIPDSGISPVVPNASNQVIMTGTNGIEVIGGLNTLTFDLTDLFVGEFIPDSGTSPVVPNVSNQITMTGTNGIEVIGGLNTLTFDLTALFVGEFIPDSGTSPVVPDISNQVTMTGTNGIEVIGGLNTLTFDLTALFVGEFIPDSGTSPVVPDVSNQVIMTGTNGIEVIGGLNTLTFDLTALFVGEFIPDSGTSPVVPDVSNQVTMTGTGGIQVIGGLNTLTFSGAGIGTFSGFLPDAGTSPVIPDGIGEITLAGGNGIITTGSLNTVTVDMESPFDGDWAFTCPASEATWIWDCTLECIQFRGINTGFTDTHWITCQAGVQTLDAVQTVIASITLPDSRVSSVRTTFSGARSDHSAALSGNIIYGARRSGGGAVEMSPAVVNVMDDGAASVTIDAGVSGNDIQLLVTGEAATQWNWVITYEYQILNTNA